jgi:ubiquitin C-terminal hydrolase
MKVPAQKRFSIQKAPNVLTIQLNRFVHLVYKKLSENR